MNDDQAIPHPLPSFGAVVVICIASIAVVAFLPDDVIYDFSTVKTKLHEGTEKVQARPYQTHPFNPTWFYVAQRDGTIIKTDGLWHHGGPEKDQVMIDLQLDPRPDEEYGLKSFTILPNNRAMVAYTTNEGESRLQEYAIMETAWRPIGPIIQPTDYTSTPYHNVGEVEYHQGTLYATWGDPSRVPGAQYPSTVYGSIQTYTRQGDTWINNTFSIGHRNPWRIAPDPHYPDTLWVADVGAHQREEITIARPGTNHGWPWYEGTAKYTNTTDPGQPFYVPTEEPPFDLTWPLYEYVLDGKHCAIIGGDFAVSHYWYADHCSRELYAYSFVKENIINTYRFPYDRINSIDSDGSDGLLVSTRLGTTWHMTKDDLLSLLD